MTDLITNGAFAADASWTKGTGWTISGGQAIAAAVAASQFLRQPVNACKNASYLITFDVANFSSGDVRVSFDSGDVGTARGANGTFAETITLTAPATEIRFGRSTGDFTGRIDNVSCLGLSSVIDEAALANALSCALAGNFASPEQALRMAISAYLSSTPPAIAMSEAGFAAALSAAFRGDYPSPERRARGVVTAYIGGASV
jgi:hypothetical protein